MNAFNTILGRQPAEQNSQVSATLKRAFDQHDGDYYDSNNRNNNYTKIIATLQDESSNIMNFWLAI